MQRKHDDHHASHNNKANQALHLVSSSVFLVCYVLLFFDITTAMCLGLAALFLRQFGHAILEPPCHDAEKLLLMQRVERVILQLADVSEILREAQAGRNFS